MYPTKVLGQKFSDHSVFRPSLPAAGADVVACSAPPCTMQLAGGWCGAMHVATDIADHRPASASASAPAPGRSVERRLYCDDSGSPMTAAQYSAAGVTSRRRPPRRGHALTDDHRRRLDCRRRLIRTGLPTSVRPEKSAG